MSEHREAIRLTVHPVRVDSPEFGTICGWPFPDNFVHRLIRDDIPQRVVFGRCLVFLYRDPTGQPVGFGTLDICSDYCTMVGDALHPYIPLLAVNPTVRSLGYGTSILRHLIAEAVVLSRLNSCADILFLDVYTSSARARALYERELFRPITGEIFDPVEQNPTSSWQSASQPLRRRRSNAHDNDRRR
jgi:GNAT superfamily N-acetyltransferase